MDIVIRKDAIEAEINKPPTTTDLSPATALGPFGSPGAMINFTTGQAVTIFTLFMVQIALVAFPSDAMLLATAVLIVIILFTAEPVVTAILMRHPSRPWGYGWKQIMDFILLVSVLFVAGYGTELLRQLWTSGTTTTTQSVVITILTLEAVVLFLSTVREQITLADSRTHAIITHVIALYYLRNKRRNQQQPRI